MSLQDYAVERDRFEFSDEALDFCFPCSACKFVKKAHWEEPCKHCDHNANAEPEPKAMASWKRDDYWLADALELVDVSISPLTIKGWTDAQCQQAEDWAAAVHFAASDNDVEIPPRPDFLLT